MAYSQKASRYRTAAGSFDAVKDALQLWLQLKQQDFQNKRQTGADSRAQAELQRQIGQDADTREYRDAQTQLEREQQAQTTLTGNRALGQYLTTNFSGPTDDNTAKFLRDAGLGGALEEQQTLPARRQAPAVSAAPQAQPPTYFQPGQADQVPPAQMGAPSAAPQAGTGVTSIRQGESEKARIAMENRFSADTRATADRGSRENIAGMQAQSRAAALAQSADYQRASLALRARGIDVTADSLALMTARAFDNTTEQQFQMQMQAVKQAWNMDPFAAYRALMAAGGAASAAPPPPIPQVPTLAGPAQRSSTPGRFSATPEGGR